MTLADALAAADDPQAGRFVQSKARGVLRADPGLNSPDAAGLRGSDQPRQKCPAYATALRRGIDENRMLDDPGVDVAAAFRGAPRPSR